MHSAISNLGAGGMQDVQLSDIANSVLYGCFFLGGFFAGSVNVRFHKVWAIFENRSCQTNIVVACRIS